MGLHFCGSLFALHFPPPQAFFLNVENVTTRRPMLAQIKAVNDVWYNNRRACFSKLSSDSAAGRLRVQPDGFFGDID